MEFQSPIGVASHAPKALFTPEMLSEVLLKYVNAGASYVHTPVVTVLNGKRTVRYGLFYKNADWGPSAAGSLEGDGFRLDEGIKLMKLMKEKLPKDIPLIANVMGPAADLKGWVKHAKTFEDLGADLIELDVSCGLGITDLGHDMVKALEEKRYPLAAGVVLGDQPELVAPITEAVADAVSIPVGVKLAPETAFPRFLPIANVLKQKKGWISAINAVVTVFTPPDIYNHGKPLFPDMDINPIGAAFGEWIRYLCYRDVALIAQNVPGLDIAAIGGLTKPSYLIEAMMLGAKLTEVSSGLISKGIMFLKNSTTFLSNFLDNNNYGSAEKIVGLGLKYIKPFADAKASEQVAQTDASKCTGCKICVENLCPAGYMENGIAMVKQDKCSGCGMCVMNCPQGARKLVHKASV